VSDVKSEEKWSNLVYISVLGKYQKKSDIARAWDISINGGPLYQSEVKEDIDELVEKDLIEKRGSTLYANFSSENFRNELKKHFKERIESKDDSRIDENILDNLDGFIDFISNDKVRETCFDLDSVVKMCNGNTDIAKSTGKFKFFDLMINIYSSLYVPKMLDDVDDEGLTGAILTGLKTTLDGFFNQVARESGYDMKVLKVNLKNLSDQGVSLEVLEKAYTQLVQDKIYSPLEKLEDGN